MLLKIFFEAGCSVVFSRVGFAVLLLLKGQCRMCLAVQEILRSITVLGLAAMNLKLKLPTECGGTHL